jgi:hypothetical protein
MDLPACPRAAIHLLSTQGNYRWSDPANTLTEVDTVSVPLRLRERMKLLGFAGSGSTSSVSWTPVGTVLSILLKSTAHVALKNVFDAAKLGIAVSVNP